MQTHLYHIGTPRHSGRYPWGSGENPNQRTTSFLAEVEELRKKGLSEVEIAKGLGISTTQLRARKSIARNEKRKEDAAMALRLKEKGMSNVAIGERMGVGESQVRALLAPSERMKADTIAKTADMLKDALGDDGFLDIGEGNQNQLGISKPQFNAAVAVLTEQGYKIIYDKVEQVGNPGHYTSFKILARPGEGYKEYYANPEKLKLISKYSEDGGRSFEDIKPPVSIDSKRVAVRYGDEGGSDKDGVIEVRRGVEDISLGGKNYAQVRIAVDNTHFLKGMALYSDDLPNGVDLLFNTNKKNTGNKLDAMKKLEADPESPFKAAIKSQRTYVDSDGNKKQSVMNVVNEEGDWDKWSRTLSSQMLSKQSTGLAKQQLDIMFGRKQKEFDEIMALTNPAVKKRLLASFADDCDAAAVHLKAASMPRQRAQVILPINAMKDDEVYAPNFRDGESVVLVRFPHGGIFEIPELKVNNRNREAKNILGKAEDAIGINSKVAQRLSGADFDGDTVLVIPNGSRAVKTSGALKGLANFDPQKYKLPEGAPKMKAKTKQTEMGKISNLITDMTLLGATQDEIAKAVRHSMVVIDAEKHHLNYKQSEIDNGIRQLKQKYQPTASGRAGGASTIISLASSQERIPQRVPRKASEGGHIDPATGKLVFTNTNASYVDKKTGKTIYKTVKSSKMALTDDAHELVSNARKPMELAYATHANKLKALANQTRKEMVSTTPIKYSPAANKAFAEEVARLKADLNIAKKNAPFERMAQHIASAQVSMKMKANPEMDYDDIKKLKGKELVKARNRVGAKKTLVPISEKQWAAIQAGAISNNMLNNILMNADLDKVKQLALPKSAVFMTPSKIGRARTMLRNGHSQAEVADALGVSVSALAMNLKGE